MTRKKGRPMLRWLEDVYDDLSKMKAKGWGGEVKNKRMEADCSGGQSSP
jgi:hypothetical protein